MFQDLGLIDQHIQIIFSKICASGILEFRKSYLNPKMEMFLKMLCQRFALNRYSPLDQTLAVMEHVRIANK